MTHFSGARVVQSPNYWAGRQGHQITAIVIHSTAGYEPGVLEWFGTPASSVSSHYVVNRDGSIVCCVDEDDTAWHAGIVTADSAYDKGVNPNFWSLGIEHENDGHNSLGLTPAQLAASTRLIADIRRRRGNLPFIPHHLINADHARCPGANFPLAALDAATRQQITATAPTKGVSMGTPTTAAIRTFPDVYLQRDGRWANQRLGTANGFTLGGYGCYVTSFAMLAGHFGHHVTPAALDDILTNRGIYVDGGEMPDDGLARVYPNLRLERVIDWSTAQADLSVLAALSRDPSLAVVLGLDFDADPSDGIQTHFVAMRTCDGRSVWIYDPWYGDGHNSDNFSVHYGNPATTIQKAIVYRGPAPASTTPTPTIVTLAPVAPHATGRGEMAADDWLKAEPRVKARALKHIKKGSLIVVLDKTTMAEGYTWRFIQSGAEYGWVLDKNTRVATTP